MAVIPGWEIHMKVSIHISMRCVVREIWVQFGIFTPGVFKLIQKSLVVLEAFIPMNEFQWEVNPFDTRLESKMNWNQVEVLLGWNKNLPPYWPFVDKTEVPCCRSFLAPYEPSLSGSMPGFTALTYKQTHLAHLFYDFIHLLTVFQPVLCVVLCIILNIFCICLPGNEQLFLPCFPSRCSVVLCLHDCLTFSSLTMSVWIINKYFSNISVQPPLTHLHSILKDS